MHWVIVKEVLQWIVVVEAELTLVRVAKMGV